MARKQRTFRGKPLSELSRQERRDFELSEQVKLLRSFPSFDPDGKVRKIKITDGFDAASGYDLRQVSKWSKHKKAKVREYFKEVSALSARPHYIYKPTTKERLQKAQQYAQHDKRLPRLKAAFVPVAGEEKPEIRFTDTGHMVVKESGVYQYHASFDPMLLATDSDAAINKAISEMPEMRWFQIQAGKFEIGNVHDKAVLKQEVKRLQSKYSDPARNNYWRNWMKGIIGYRFPGLEKGMDYIGAKQARKRELQRKRRIDKRRMREAFKEQQKRFRKF